MLWQLTMEQIYLERTFPFSLDFYSLGYFLVCQYDWVLSFRIVLILFLSLLRQVLPNFLSLILFTLLRSRYLHSECPWTLREQVVSLILSANPALNHWCWLSAGVECRFSAWRNCSNSRSMLISLHTTHIYPHLLPLCYNCEWNCLN